MRNCERTLFISQIGRWIPTGPLLYSFAVAVDGIPWRAAGDCEVTRPSALVLCAATLRHFRAWPVPNGIQPAQHLNCFRIPTTARDPAQTGRKTGRVRAS